MLTSILRAVLLVGILQTVTFSNDQRIFDFNSSEQDPQAGKKIMKMITESLPELFVPNVENVTNRKGELAYSIASNGQGQSDRADLLLAFTGSTVDLKTGLTQAHLFLEGRGYRMFLDIHMSHRLLTKAGKDFFRQFKHKEFIIK